MEQEKREELEMYMQETFANLPVKVEMARHELHKKYRDFEENRSRNAMPSLWQRPNSSPPKQQPTTVDMNYKTKLML